jgi:hypothetical protein
VARVIRKLMLLKYQLESATSLHAAIAISTKSLVQEDQKTAADLVTGSSTRRPERVVDAITGGHRAMKRPSKSLGRAWMRNYLRENMIQ